MRILSFPGNFSATHLQGPFTHFPQIFVHLSPPQGSLPGLAHPKAGSCPLFIPSPCFIVLQSSCQDLTYVCIFCCPASQVGLCHHPPFGTLIPALSVSLALSPTNVRPAIDLTGHLPSEMSAPWEQGLPGLAPPASPCLEEGLPLTSLPRGITAGPSWMGPQLPPPRPLPSYYAPLSPLLSLSSPPRTPTAISAPLPFFLALLHTYREERMRILPATPPLGTWCSCPALTMAAFSALGPRCLPPPLKWAHTGAHTLLPSSLTQLPLAPAWGCHRTAPSLAPAEQTHRTSAHGPRGCPGHPRSSSGSDATVPPFLQDPEVSKQVQECREFGSVSNSSVASS